MSCCLKSQCALRHILKNPQEEENSPFEPQNNVLLAARKSLVSPLFMPLVGGGRCKPDTAGNKKFLT